MGEITLDFGELGVKFETKQCYGIGNWEKNSKQSSAMGVGSPKKTSLMGIRIPIQNPHHDFPWVWNFLLGVGIGDKTEFY